MSEKVRSACFVLTEGQHTKYHMLGLGSIPRLLTEGQHTIAVQSGAYPSSGQLCFLSLKVFRLESLRTEGHLRQFKMHVSLKKEIKHYQKP